MTRKSGIKIIDLTEDFTNINFNGNRQRYRRTNGTSNVIAVKGVKI